MADSPTMRTTLPSRLKGSYNFPSGSDFISHKSLADVSEGKERESCSQFPSSVSASTGEILTFSAPFRRQRASYTCPKSPE